MTSYAEPSVSLSSARMPLLGFGTWQLSDDEAETATRAALDAGYRHVDTATMYRNEAGVGRGLRASGLARDDVFVTTKLPPDREGRERETLEQSLAALDVDAVDLWLVHWMPSDSVAVWREVVRAREDGLAREVGVSNYTLADLDELTEATGVTPAVNQIRWSPALYDADVAAGHAERGVVLEGYSPFKTTDLRHPVLERVAGAHDATTAQVVVAWHVAHGFVVIPKSAQPERIVANAAGAHLELTEDEVRAVDGLAI